MPCQTSLPHASGSPTSEEAARQAENIAPRQIDRIMAYFASRGPLGATAGEVEEATGVNGNSVRPRLVHLKAAGRLIDSGQTRLTKSGRKAAVLVLAIP